MLLDLVLLDLVLLDLVLLDSVSGVSGLGNRGGLDYDSGTDQGFGEIASGFFCVSDRQTTMPHMGDEPPFLTPRMAGSSFGFVSFRKIFNPPPISRVFSEKKARGIGVSGSEEPGIHRRQAFSWGGGDGADGS